MSIEHCFLLPDITCENCVKHIEDTLRAHQDRLGIESFKVKLVGEQLKIRMLDDTHSDDELFKSIYILLDSIGFTCVKEKPVRSPHWLLGFLGIGMGVAILIVTMLVPVLSIPAMIIIASLSVPLTLLLGAKSYERAAKLARKGILEMDTLFAISTLTVITVSIASFFVPWLPMMFDTGLLIFGFRHLGIAIKKSISKNVTPELTFKDILSPTVCQIKDDIHCQMPIENIAINDLLEIKPGEVIPVDGVCEEETIVLETTITGNPEPRKVFPGEQLLAGMCVAKQGQALRIRATTTANESTLAKLDHNILQASIEKAPLETFTKKIFGYFIFGIIGISILSGILVGYFFSPALAIQCAVAVLVSACPCTLGLITPLALQIGMDKADENGVGFKSPKNLEEASTIDTVVFDLNGTLTMNNPFVRKSQVLSKEISADDLFAYAAILETNESHSTAKVIYDYVVRQNTTTATTDWKIEPSVDRFHGGTVAFINGESFKIGSQEMMTQAGIDTKKIESQLEDEKKLLVGDSIIYLARGNEILGYFIINDPLRKDAAVVIDALKAQGKNIVICSGADKTTVQRYASALGIFEEDNILFGRAPSPETRKNEHQPDKQTDIKALQEKGYHVAMIGDAGNDSVAIATSEFGIAIKSRNVSQLKQGNAVTQNEAGAVISDQSLLPVLTAFAVAKQTVSNIKQNLLFSLFYNVSSMVLASGLLLTIGVTLNPSVGVALMIVQSVLILLNAIRFKKQKLAHLELSQEEEAPVADSSYRYVNRIIANQNKAQPVAENEKQDVVENSKGGKLFAANSDNRSSADQNEIESVHVMAST